MLKGDDPYFLIQEDMKATFGGLRFLIEKDHAKSKKSVRMRVFLATYWALYKSVANIKDRPASTFPHELLKLPPIHIPSFTRLSKEVVQFKDLFRAAIDNN